MKEFITDTLELDKFLEYDIFLKNDHNLKKPIEVTKKLKAWKSLLFEKETTTRDLKDFSSLERIRIVVDSLLGDESIEEICLKEGISQKTFYEWKSDFLEAFKRHSEDVLIQEKLNVTTKELILRETNVDTYNFFRRFIDIYDENNLVIPKGEKIINIQ